MTNAINADPLLPTLTDSLSSCIRWRQRDLDEALEAQLRMLDEDTWATAQRTDELLLAHHVTAYARCTPTTAQSAAR